MPTVRLTGANFQVVNGLGATDTLHGAGNLIVGYNDLGLAGSQTASVDVSLDSGTSFNAVLLEPRATGGQNAPSVRVAPASA